jgi:hypothetical protein
MATESADRAAEQFVELGDEYRLASARMMQATIQHHVGDPLSAIPLQERANAKLAALGPPVEAAETPRLHCLEVIRRGRSGIARAPAAGEHETGQDSQEESARNVGPSRCQ